MLWNTPNKTARASYVERAAAASAWACPMATPLSGQPWHQQAVAPHLSAAVQAATMPSYSGVGDWFKVAAAESAPSQLTPRFNDMDLPPPASEATFTKHGWHVPASLFEYYRLRVRLSQARSSAQARHAELAQTQQVNEKNMAVAKAAESAGAISSFTATGLRNTT